MRHIFIIRYFRKEW